MNREQIKSIIRDVIEEMQGFSIPIGVSNRHVHLCEEDMAILFPHMELTKKKDLQQIGEFASNQLVTLKGPKGEIKNVRVLGPLRQSSQVEVSLTDARTLGVKPPIVLSGNLKDAAPITMCTEYGSITKSICIVAKRHIHMSTVDADHWNLSHGDTVRVSVEGVGRRTIFDDVIVRVAPNFVLEMHIDTDEANAANVNGDMVGRLVKSE